MKSFKHYVIGLSGGVDSSVAACLLKEQGHKVTGVFMQNWKADKEDPHCSAQQDLTDARIICDKLAIPLQTVDFSDAYWENVFQYFLDELAKGRTPNPDILCNQEIKFKAFLNHALTLGADEIATGHYSIITKTDETALLEKGMDATKDQSYFLHRLNQRQLSCSYFPIGHLPKKAVRTLAAEKKLINATKKDSTGICFIGERRFKTFLREYLLTKPGVIETAEGVIIGNHEGLMFYTIGQRQGLGIGGHKKYKESPWYVVHKDLSRNALIVAQDHNHPLLMSSTLACDQVHWINDSPVFPYVCHAKIRYRQEDQSCIIYKEDQHYRVEFTEAQRAITPGQSVVFYNQTVCLGGGVIL